MNFTENDLEYLNDYGYTKTEGRERFTKQVGDKIISVLPYAADMFSHNKNQRLWVAVLNQDGKIIDEGQYLTNGIFLKDFELRVSRTK